MFKNHKITDLDEKITILVDESHILSTYNKNNTLKKESHNIFDTFIGLVKLEHFLFKENAYKASNHKEHKLPSQR